MRRHLASLLALAALLAACAAPPPPPPPPPTAQIALPTAAAPPAPTPTAPPAGRPDPARIREASLPAERAAGGRAALRDGIYREQISGPEGVRELVVALSDLLAFADLDGDGVEEAGALLITLAPGEPPAFELLALAGAGEPRPIAGLSVGAGIVVEGLSGAGDALLLDTLRPAPGDDPCCPTVRTRQRLALRAGRLAVVEQSALQLSPPGGPPAGEPLRIELPGPAGAAAVGGVAGPRALDAYLVRGSAGQRAIFSLGSTAGTATLGVAPPEGPPLVALEAGAQNWEGQLPHSGDYLILVTGSGANTPYSLQVQLFEPPPPPTAAPPPAPAPTDGRTIFLTFDDGPHPTYTPLVLDLLARYGARATFFVIGRQAEAHPELIARMAAEGHQVANHTYSHAALGGMGRELFLREVGAAAGALGAGAAPCLRPPYGSRDAATEGYAAELGLRVVMWSIDPADWARPGADAIAERVLARAHPGAIVLLHDGGGDRSQTVAALDRILAGLSAQGYAFAPAC